MPTSAYLPVLELTRGEVVESIHFGAFTVVDRHGNLVAAHGDPNLVTFLRSSSKPFQALPFVEAGGAERWDFSPKEIAILCASHTGTDDHANTLSGMQAKIQVGPDDLLCGTHMPIDGETHRFFIRNDAEPTPNRHNCSGKHTGMLAFARLKNLPIADYINPQHPIQIEILRSFSEICGVDPDRVAMGTDGCSAPNFAIPLHNAALGFARLCDPRDLPPARAVACRKITAAMTAHPEMIAGPGKFDTRLMQATGGKIVSKGGAEGYQSVGIMPGAIAAGSPALGISIKVSDGDLRGRARPAVTLEILRQLGAITPQELQALAEFGPVIPLYNFRQIHVGDARPSLEIKPLALEPGA